MTTKITKYKTGIFSELLDKSVFSLKNGEVLLGATRSWRRKFLRKFSEKKVRFCKKLGVLGLRGKMYTVGLVLGFWMKNGVFFPGKNPQ